MDRRGLAAGTFFGTSLEPARPGRDRGFLRLGDWPLRFVLASVLACLSVAAILPARAAEQAIRRGGGEFTASRSVVAPQGKGQTILVTEFYTHGELNAEGTNLLVFARSNQVPPFRVLQIGPGDFCRVAIQLIPGQAGYEILYGGPPVSGTPIPPWTCKDGLLMETRQYVDCDLRTVESLREAFNKAKPIGADYVDGVFHSYNPFSFKPEPFLTHYSGNLHIAQAHKYGFMTSSQDASFLLLDGKVVVSAPGRHGHARQAKEDMRGDIRLNPGVYKFDYYHAAVGGFAMMIAAWEIDPAAAKPEKPQAIPAELWHAAAVARVPTENLTTIKQRTNPDFLVKPLGEAPLPDTELTVIAVAFKDMSPKALSARGQLEWDFGDGQTSEEADPQHVYLRPGTYTVKLVGRKANNVEIANRVVIAPPPVTKNDKQYTLDDFLPVLAKYKPETMDAATLTQLVAVYDAKASQAEAAPEGPTASQLHEAAREGRLIENKLPSAAELAARGGAARNYIAMAVKAGKAAFVEQSPATGDAELLSLATLVGPMARDRMGDSQLAFQIWQGAAKKIKDAADRGRCELEAADVAINDLLKPELAKPLLDSATKNLAQSRDPVLVSLYRRVWADYYATTGDGKAARKAYGQAESAMHFTGNHIERTARRGAHNRSTEEFIKTGQLDRAAMELHLWQQAFPSEKMDGQISYMSARYWAARKMYDQAIAMCEQLLTSNPQSPYIEALMLLAADCEVKRGKNDRAIATLQSLLSDYPGGPAKVINEAKEKLKTLQGAAPAGDKGKKPTTTRKTAEK